MTATAKGGGSTDCIIIKIIKTSQLARRLTGKKSDTEVAEEARNAMNGEAALRDAAMGRYKGFMQDYQKLIEDAEELFKKGNFNKNGEGESDGDNNKDTGKSTAERLAEIRQKISEYLEGIENKHNDKLKEIYNLRNELITNEGEKRAG